MDGSEHADSIRRMFPKELHNRVLLARDENDRLSLARQQETQASEYLKSIGRTAEIKLGHVEKQLVNINVEASNKLFSELTKFDPFLNTFPYWIGTKERIEGGVRYIYKTSQDKTDDGYDLITFRKTRDDGTTVEERNYKIDGNEPVLIN